MAKRKTPESLEDLLSEVVAEAWAAGLGASEDVGWRRAGQTQDDGTRTLAQLELARADSRRLLNGSAHDDGNEFAIGAAENRVNYVIGDAGLKYEAVPVVGYQFPPGVPRDDSLVGEAQKFIDEFAELNCLPDLEAETLAAADRDGDRFLRLFPANGIPEVRPIEAECVRPPEGEIAERAAWGVVTGSPERPYDQQTVSGYYVDEGNGVPTFVPEAEIVHFAMNKDSRYPRGWPTFEPVGRALRRAEELLVAMTATGKARAKIALIEVIPGFTREKADNLVNRLTTKYQDDPAGGPPKLQTVEELPYGARIRAREGTTFTLPSHNLGAADLIEAIQANLRCAGARLNMPEWMFSALPDAKYSNAFVVEAPTLKSFKRLQRLMIHLFGEGRIGQRASLVWRAMTMAAQSGKLNPTVLSAVRIKCSAPSLEVRDKAQEATMNATYIDKGVKPVALVQQELGYDPEELAQMAAKNPTLPVATPPVTTPTNPVS